MTWARRLSLVPAIEVKCGDALDEGSMVHSWMWPHEGQIILTVGDQQADGSHSRLNRLTFAPDEIVKVVRGVPTPWQRAHGYPNSPRHKVDGCGCAYCLDQPPWRRDREATE